jgi:hypothetical protein
MLNYQRANYSYYSYSTGVYKRTKIFVRLKFIRLGYEFLIHLIIISHIVPGQILYP